MSVGPSCPKSKRDVSTSLAALVALNANGLVEPRLNANGLVSERLEARHCWINTIPIQPSPFGKLGTGLEGEGTREPAILDYPFALSVGPSGPKSKGGVSTSFAALVTLNANGLVEPRLNANGLASDRLEARHCWINTTPPNPPLEGEGFKELANLKWSANSPTREGSEECGHLLWRWVSPPSPAGGRGLG